MSMLKGNPDVSDSAPPPAGPRAQIAPVELPGLSGLVTLLVCVVVVTVLYVAREVLIPITLAGLLAFILAPLVALLRQTHMGRAPAVILAVLLALGVIVSLSFIIVSQGIQVAGDIPRYTTTIEAKLSTLQDFAGNRVFGTLGGLGKRIEEAGNAVAPPAPAAKPAPLPVEMHQAPLSPLEMAQRILTPVLSPLATAAIVFIVTIFMLLQQEDLRDRLIRLFGARDLHRATGALDEAAHRLSRYFLTQLALNALFGAVIGTGLFFIGVPGAVLWGIAAALLRFVPYVGAFLSAAVPFALAAAVDPGWSMLVWTGALFLISETAMGQGVEPLVYGHSTGLSPVSVVVAAIFWGWIWGPVGLILSMPLTLCLVVLGRHVKQLEFIDVALGDQPALTPAESFYQRMLANDPDEAQDQAEILLRERSLSDYYDEVALKGLSLAANDFRRGVLTPGQIDGIEVALEELIGQLADHKDVPPGSGQTAGEATARPADKDTLSRDVTPPASPSSAPSSSAPSSPAPSSPASVLTPESLIPAWRSEAPVLCVAGRGPLDRTASLMLAQLLDRHGLKARVISHEAGSHATIASLDSTGVAMICLCYLEITGSPSHLRYLLRRLRQRMPGIPILVGIWPTDETVLNDDRLRAAIGADFYVTSLREAVTLCIRTAQGEDGKPDPA